MRSIDVYTFYSLGQELGTIKRLPDEPKVFQLLTLNWGIQNLLNALLGGQMVELGVSRGPAEELKRRIDDIINRYCLIDGQWEWPDAEKKLSSWDSSMLRDSLQKFENVLAAETKISAVYHVTKKGIFNTQDLVESGDRSFTDDLRSFIPDQALEEYQFAGRALAFDLATAAAFHVSRAVESMLREYRNCFLSGQPGRTMGAIIKMLKKYAESHPTPCPHEKTIRQLEQFVHLDRNRIMHPEDVLTVDQAIICFYNGISVVTAMATEVKMMRGEPRQGVLPMGESVSLSLETGE